VLGQLQDASNTTIVEHYLALLEGDGLLMGVPKYAEHKVRQRASSPKLRVLTTELMTAFSRFILEEALLCPVEKCL
jgi:predicted AAA+ superfamily ATPase